MGGTQDPGRGGAAEQSNDATLSVEIQQRRLALHCLVYRVEVLASAQLGVALTQQDNVVVGTAERPRNRL